MVSRINPLTAGRLKALGVLVFLGLILSSMWGTGRAMATAGAAAPFHYDTYPPASVTSSNYVVAAKWDKTALTFSILNCPKFLNCAAAQQVVREAAAAWDSVCGLSITGVPSNGDIVVAWYSGNHGDGEPFDGPGGVLAHAFFPKPFLGALAGDLHLDNDEHWVVGPASGPLDVDLKTTVLHEMGHSLGLDHSQDPSALMWDEYTGVRGIGPDDIAGIQSLYGPPGPNEGAPQTSSPTGVTAQATITVRVRSGPGTNFPEIGKVDQSVTVNVLGRDAAGDWLLIDFNGLQGWVAGWLFAVNGDINTLPVTDQTGGGQPPPQPQPTEPSQPGDVTALALSTVKMRQGPSTTAPEIGQIPQGTSVRVVARSEGYNWIVVDYNGLQGWAAAWLFKVNGSLRSLPVQ